MGTYHKVALSLLGLIFIGLVQAQSPRILFLGVNTFRAGTNYEATVTSLSGETLSVTVSILNNKTRQIISTRQASIFPGNQASFSLPIPDTVIDSNGVFVVRVEEGTSYRNETQINFREKNRSLFIVTDKSIYKPGATVKFRAFAVTVELLPKTDPMTVEIFDPKGNKIKQWLNQIASTGVISGELELSTLTTLGTWKIKATSMNHEGEETFEVDEYTLPKFEVAVTLNPTFIVISDTNPMRMSARVTATYNIGTPVDGNLTLVVKGERTSAGINPISVQRQISGVQNVDITFPAGTFSQCRVCPVVVEASVTDSLTGETRIASMKFQTWETLEKLEFLQSADYIKPGLVNRFQLKLTQQDGSPLLNIGKQVLVTVTETMNDFPSSRRTTREELYTFDLPASGILTIEHQARENATQITIEAEYNGATRTKYVTKQFKTLSGNSLEVEQILLPGGQKPSPQTQIEFTVRATEDLSVIFYQILSKSSVVASGKHMPQFPSRTLSIRISATTAMSPSATIVVFYVNPQRELIAAAQRFEVTFGLDNQVTITWDAERKRVNENALLTVRAEPSSYVSVGAVDQSVLLLGESNDMTVDRIIEEFMLYENHRSSPYPGPFFRGGGVRFRRSFFWPYYSSSSDTTKVLEDSGLVFMTDALVYNEPFNDIYPVMMEDGIEGANFPMMRKSGSTTVDVAQVYVRKFFPESWIWDSKTTGSDGLATFSVTVPDTLTKWVATAFALHPTSGLGIPAQRANLTAFQPFFMRVDKPYSVIRGEEVVVNVLVFNYLGGSRQATVELRQSAEFKVKENVNDVTAESKTLTKTVQVEDQKGASVSFIVVPGQLGYLTLNLRASTTGAADALEETLLVEPEGRLVEQNNAIFVSLESTNTYSSSETVTFPLTDVVPGSRAIVITVIGDLLGTTLSGLGQLIRMPYGCGEQNMISFVPNIVVRKYLESAQVITPKQRIDTTRFMEAGYQRELTYQRSEGSFSAFGNSDPAGSTWLTAFVVQSFKQAQPYIFVDDELLARSLNWLIQNTFDRRTNTFSEVGNVIHDAMQGGQTNTMTAYVLIALEFCSDLNQTVDGYLDVLNRARQTVENSADGTTDAYSLAIMAYALQLSNSPSVTRILNQLDSTARLEQGMKYWKLTTEAGPESKPTMCRRCHRQNNQVELASFVLLTHVLRGEVTAALAIARYLMSAKNPQGGFYSTQDTVWGLTALAEFSAASRGGGQQYTATITVGTNQPKQFTVNSQNAQVLQRYELMDDEISGNAVDVKVEVSGSGSGLVEISNQYYTTEQEENNRLKLTVETKERNSNVREVKGCVNVLDNTLKDMIVMEISDQSGFPVDVSSIQVTGNIRRVEKEGKKTSIYYGDIPPGQEQCAVMVAYKENDVMNVQAASARAFGYYSGAEVTTVATKSTPTNMATKSSGNIVTTILLLSVITWLFHQA